MKKMKNVIIWGAVAYGVYHWWRKNEEAKAAAKAALAKKEPLPTDTMAAGSTIPAAQGVVKEGHGLSVMPAAWPYGY